MKGLMVAVVLAFTASTIAPAIAEVVGGGTQLAQAEGKKKKGAKPEKAHKPAKKPAPKAHKGGKKGKKAA